MAWAVAVVVSRLVAARRVGSRVGSRVATDEEEARHLKASQVVSTFRRFRTSVSWGISGLFRCFWVGRGCGAGSWEPWEDGSWQMGWRNE